MAVLMLLSLVGMVLPHSTIVAASELEGTGLTVWLVGLILLTLGGEHFYAHRAKTGEGRRTRAMFALATAIALLAFIIDIVKSL
jgi:hypothetical protein